MNEKIQKLVNQLVQECRKEDVTLQIGVIDGSGEITTVLAGDGDLLGFIILKQYEEMKKVVEKMDCDCLIHRKLQELYGVTRKSAPLDEMLAEFLRDL